MKKIFLFMMVTADGYFEGVDHDISWHNAAGQEFLDFVDAQTGTLGTIMFGKRTYDMMAAFWPHQGMELEPTTATIMGEKPKIVVSDTDFTPEWENTRVISADVFTEVQKLREGEGGDIGLFGSNSLCVSLMEHGLVDEFRIMVNPVAIGAGTPLFAGIKKRFNLKLIDTRRFDSGNVLNTYVPAN